MAVVERFVREIFIACATVQIILFSSLASWATASDIDFNRDVQPILSDNCFVCHGNDISTRKAGLRLDHFEGATHVRKDGTRAITPGDSSASEILKRITSQKASRRMPPISSNKPALTEAEIKIIREWIDAGAVYKPHWAFLPPKRLPPPKIDATKLPKNVTASQSAVDAFIRTKLLEHGLQPSPEADKASLLRRVTLDLTGLPPTLEEIDAFLADTSEGAYEKVVDRLLASPRYGEQMTRYWLDLARYGDTHGLHLDNERQIWPYRDWVLQAFNSNKPFDEFALEQIAGDLLPKATTEQKVATGFSRCNISTNEGGVIPEEAFVRNTIDRVETTGTVFLGLTTGCAACHDHKFDPLSQKEFYQLYAFFNSNKENPMDGNSLRHAPMIKVPTEIQVQEKKALTAEQKSIQQEIKEALAKLDYKDPTPNAKPVAQEPREIVWIDDEFPQGAKAMVAGHPWKFVTKKDKLPVYSGSSSHRRTGEGLVQHYFIGASKPLRVGDGDTLFAYVYLDSKNTPETVQLQFHANGSWNHRAHWGADKAHGKGTKNGSFFKAGELPETGKWVRLEVNVINVGLKPGDTIDGWAFTQFGGTVTWDYSGIKTRMPQENGSQESFAEWLQINEILSKPSVPKNIAEAIKTKSDKRKPSQNDLLLNYFLEHVCASQRMTFDPLHSRLTEVTKKIKAIETAIPQSMVMQEMVKPKPAFLLERGEYDQHGEQVKRQLPSWLPPLPKDAPANRLGFAQWLLSPEHPLTARVTVNRFWQQLFGTGIVPTSDDFGIQGTRPTHPHLLDWLAVDFRESGWDVKRMMKQLVMSQTYRQSSRATSEILKKDPDNQWLARGPRYRIDAEMIRDQALFTSGLLVEKVGGKSVKPYQPDGVWKAVGYTSSNTSNFKQDHGTGLYRRSMYTFWKRTAPPPSLALMDAPTRESCTSKRERTNTPLAALVLMNDVQYIETARHLARRVLTQTPSRAADANDSNKNDGQRIARMFRSVTSHEPTPKQQEILKEQLAWYLASFEKNPQSAEKLLAVGDSPRDKKLPLARHAAWTMLANIVLNLDASLNK